MTDDRKIRDGLTDFGFTEVPVAEKARRVRGVFDSVAGSYDRMNDLMSLGVHRLWKDSLMDWLLPRPSQRLLDVAGGTGDIAQRWRKRGGGPVTVCDINAEMIGVGRDRLEQGGGDPGIGWVVGDAERLPVADRSVERVTIAFGLRNVTRIDLALAEMRRVLKPGGRFLCLEFSKPTQPWLGPGVRRLFVPGAALARAGGGARRGGLPVPGRKHPAVPGPAGPRRAHAPGRLREGRLAQPLGRDRRHPFRLAALTMAD